MILVVYGGLGVVYGPLLAGGAVWTFLGWPVSAQTILAVLSIATGIGLLRLYSWARPVAVLVAAFGLVFVHAPALLGAAANGAWYAIDWLGLAGNVVVLFAVLRRWPVEPAAVR
jgi:hypothetical protein